MALHAVHVGVPGRVSGVDAASCKSVGYTGGTGDIFTNCHLLVFACGYLQYHVLLLCNPSYSGEYRINFISSLILPSLWTGHLFGLIRGSASLLVDKLSCQTSWTNTKWTQNLITLDGWEIQKRLAAMTLIVMM